MPGSLDETWHYPAAWPLPNLWLGVTAEDQRRADERIPLLLQCPAAKRFVSYEPALGPVDLERWMFRNDMSDDGARFPSGRLDLVICGPETGPGRRPMDPAWRDSLLSQCRDAGVPFFDKQDRPDAVREFPKTI